MTCGEMTNSMSGSKSNSSQPSWKELFAYFPTATPELAARRDLQRRNDTKFVLPSALLGELTSALVKDYAALAPADLYRTLYFDTAALDLFHAHRCGRRLRHKVRIRIHPERQRAFLEIKTRQSELLTVKIRRPRSTEETSLSKDDQDFVRAHTGLSSVLPQVWSIYRRLTLIGFQANERVTIDLELRFEKGGNIYPMHPLAIVEVKQWPFSRLTPAMTALRAMGIRPAWSSKYCTAIHCTHSGLRCNRFLPGLRALEKVAA